MKHLLRPAVLTAMVGLIAFAAVAPLTAQLPTPTSQTSAVRTVTVIGAGETVQEATDQALTQLRQQYLVLSYTTTGGGCHYNPLVEVWVCWSRVEARVLVGSSPFFP